MSVTHTVLRQYKDQSASPIYLSESVVGNTENNFDDAAIPIAVDHSVPWACVQTNLQSLCLSASGAVTVYTNAIHSGAPQDTIHLSAGQALCWTLAGDGIAKCPFAGNVTAMYVTNAGAAVVAFKIRAVLIQ